MSFSIGIDPGKKGGVCVIDVETAKIVEISTMPDNEHDIVDLVKRLRKDYKEPRVFIEKVGGMPGNGGSRAFNFGFNYGVLIASLSFYKFKFERVTPQKWQKIYNIGTKSGRSTNEWKNVLKTKAIDLFPENRKLITLLTADAILISEYGRRIW